MFEFLNDAVDLLNRVANGGRLVRCFLLAPVFATHWLAMAFFSVPFLAVLRLMPLFWLALLRFFDGRFGRSGRSIARCSGFGRLRRGQGATRLASPRMAAASASGATPASWGGGIGGSG